MLGPVFRHELRVAGRKPRFVVIRVAVAAGILLLLWAIYAVELESLRYTGGDPAAEGLSIAARSRMASTFFNWFAWVTLFGVLLLTPPLVAGAIAGERERRTIEYLFVTDLSNAEIVFDKLAARLLTIGKLVVATLPVLALFRLLGGVPGALLLAHFAILAAAATLAASIAVLRSVWCERARDAIPRASGGVLLWLISWPLVEGIRQLTRLYSGWTAWLEPWLIDPLSAITAAINPVLGLAAASGISRGTLGIDFDWRAVAWLVGCQLVAAAAVLAIAIRNVRRIALSEANATRKAKKDKGIARGRAAPYEHRPVLWKEMFASPRPERGKRWRRHVGVAIAGLAVASPLVTIIVNALRTGAGNRAVSEYLQVAAPMTGLGGVVLLLAIGGRAAGLVTQERERQTWLSLLTTPLEARDLVLGKTLGNLYCQRWGLLVVVLIPLAGVALGARPLLAACGVVVTLAVTAWTATAIGLAASLRHESSVKAVGWTTFALVAIGGLYTLVAGGILGAVGSDGEEMLALILPPCVPFLLAVPCFAAAESGDGPQVVGVAYFLGIVFYGVLAVAITSWNAREFDRLTDRSPEQHARPAPSP